MQKRFRVLALCCALTAGLVGSVSAGAAPVYKVGATATGIPFTFLDVKSQSIEGMMIDAARAVGQAGGFEVDIQQTTFAALIPSLTSNKIDIISAAMLRTPAREKVVQYSNPVFSYGEGLIVRADDNTAYTRMEDFKDQVVGAQVGTVFIDELNKRGIFKEVRGYDSIPDLLRDLALGRIKAGFADRPIVAYQLAQGTQNKVQLVKSYQPVVMGDVCLIVRKGDAQTLDEVNRGIAAIKADGSLERIIEKWKLN
ncbi:MULTISPECIES: ABC transporter substrate-binding protein [Pseudomonas]|jgi:polar amino acid transport system substrate-binding protein|uniref:Amino acid ABC transporter substrate-binding protein n=1 Tax=Pseudomonas chlororaphis TaxID=587753 RepID=A0AB34C8C8_9PSED|nr:MULTISPECIES: ABC transporter substrate-binding protein [Pseudomonas]AZD01505.1 ABC transporter amino acid-binding protein [Pseudomonas chlororaphis subsp. chlororaphis]AZD07684.1 ABC transporter amino acid-binding protein [Pseudomonas chlororaphis]KAA5843646.1 amino acid ABC transporter substrate-binding protein [Pseudomonas chlororaphis]MBM0285186.1 amino acid ABC transporter substrate-binding protein [Pseudomonas chlororaphis]MCP1479627.1 polar amino acid transport system substrate-bindi